MLLSREDKSVEELVLSSEKRVRLFLIADTYGRGGSLPLELFSLLINDEEDDEEITLLVDNNESKTPAAGKLADGALYVELYK